MTIGFGHRFGCLQILDVRYAPLAVTETTTSLEKPLTAVTEDQEGSEPALKPSSFEERAARLARLTRDRREEEDAEKPKELAIAREGMTAELEEAEREVGFSARLLVQATLPHSKPGLGVTEFERSNGYVTVNITARKKYGLPWGTHPRLLLAWIATEAVRTKSHELELGRSLRDFMRKLDLDEGGKSMRRLRQHMQRLFTSTVSATYQRGGQWVDVGFRPVEGARIFWDPKRPDQASLWESSIVLNRMFFEEITRKPVPVDLAALRMLAKSRSPMALDIYQWLTFRMSYLRKPAIIPWPALQLQFGGNYKRTRAFKEKFILQLKRVLELYPQADVEPSDSGLVLRPSATHVPMRLVRGRR